MKYNYGYKNLKNLNYKTFRIKNKDGILEHYTTVMQLTKFVKITNDSLISGRLRKLLSLTPQEIEDNKNLSKKYLYKIRNIINAGKVNRIRIIKFKQAIKYLKIYNPNLINKFKLSVNIANKGSDSCGNKTNIQSRQEEA